MLSGLRALPLTGPFKERTKWKEGILNLLAWRKRAGQKRSYSKVQKPGRDKRKRIRLSKQEKESAVAGCKDSVPDPYIQNLSQLCPGSEIQVQDGDLGAGAGAGESESVAGPSSGRLRLAPGRRAKVGSRGSRSGMCWVRTYDKLIEGVVDDSEAFPDNLEFCFEIPKEIEDIELT